MKRYIIAFVLLLSTLATFAQGGRTLKIGYIDMEYILEKSPDYAEAKNQLEQRASKWKQEMDAKRNQITSFKENLQAERALLTKELIEEREEEIQYLEKDLSDYQQQKFGPTGELMTQKAVLVKPIQDQVFTIVQDIAKNRSYDFIFDKSSDLTMIFAANKYDLSDLIVKRLSRAAKTDKLNPKELKRLEEEEKREELEKDPDYIAKNKDREEKKEAREKALEERKAAQEAKRQEALEKREQQKRERDAKRNGTTAPAATTTPATGTPATTNAAEDKPEGSNNRTAAPATEQPATDKPATTPAQDKAAAAKEERERKIEERKKAIEERRKQIEEEKEAARKAREEKKNQQNQDKATPESGVETGDDAQPQPEGGN